MKRIRVLIGIMGMDQHEVGAVAVCRMLRDAGMEVIYLSKFNLPAAIVDAGLEENADVIGLSRQTGIPSLPAGVLLPEAEGKKFRRSGRCGRIGDNARRHDRTEGNGGRCRIHHRSSGV